MTNIRYVQRAVLLDPAQSEANKLDYQTNPLGVLSQNFGIIMAGCKIC